MHQNDLSIDKYTIKKAALIIRAINNPLRLQLLRFIHDNGPIYVTEVYKSLGLDQSVASQQLSILKKAGFVLTEQVGRQVYYYPNYKRLEDIQVTP